MGNPKTTPETGPTAVADQEPTAAPQTAQEIAGVEQALGLSAPKSNQAIAPRAPVRMGVAPQNIEEGWRLAQFIASSELVPKGYRGRPADVLVAIQYGMEVGLPPMAALHSIYVTNGRPSLWGDGFLAVIMASGAYKDHDEYYVVDGERRDYLLDADLKKDDTTAVTTFWRTDSPRPRTATFSIAKAKKAGLWTKSGPWSDYPDRMLQMRARSFAGHNAFPDVLRGIRSAEEMIDSAVIEEPPAPPAPIQPRRASEARADASPRPAAVPAPEPAAASPVAGPTTNGIKETRGLRITNTSFVKPTDGTEPFYRVLAVADGDPEDDAYIYVTRDERIYKEAASFEGTDHRVIVGWKQAKTSAQQAVSMLVSLTIDEGASLFA